MLPFVGAADGDIEFSERLLSVCLSYYPQGALFLFFAGRVEEIKGNIDDVRNNKNCITIGRKMVSSFICEWQCSSKRNSFLGEGNDNFL